MREPTPTDPGELELQLRLPFDSTIGSSARRTLREHLGPVLDQDVGSELELVVTELATNAYLHGEAPVSMRLQLGATALRVEVRDASPEVPRPRCLATPPEEPGWGMQIVDALSSRWGVARDPSGKAVWAERELWGVRSPEVGR